LNIAYTPLDRKPERKNAAVYEDERKILKKYNVIHNIKIEVKEIGCLNVDGVRLVQYMVQWWVLVEKGNELSCSINGREILY
jgi:hypothetical protein